MEAKNCAGKFGQMEVNGRRELLVKCIEKYEETIMNIYFSRREKAVGRL